MLKQFVKRNLEIRGEDAGRWGAGFAVDAVCLRMLQATGSPDWMIAALMLVTLATGVAAMIAARRRFG